MEGASQTHILLVALFIHVPWGFRVKAVSNNVKCNKHDLARILGLVIAAQFFILTFWQRGIEVSEGHSGMSAMTFLPLAFSLEISITDDQEKVKKNTKQNRIELLLIPVPWLTCCIFSTPIHSYLVSKQIQKLNLSNQKNGHLSAALERINHETKKKAAWNERSDFFTTLLFLINDSWDVAWIAHQGAFAQASAPLRKKRNAGLGTNTIFL